MTYNEILEKIKEKLSMSLPDVNSEDIIPQNTFKDYGANSVVIVDVISRVMKDLNIQAPGPELIVAKNIDELILILLKYNGKEKN